MRKWVANSYVLSLSVLIAELVRQHQGDVRREHDAALATDSDTERTAVSKSSLNALALFLVDELQHPMQDANEHSGGTRFTALASLLRRLRRRVVDPSDFDILLTVLVGILAAIDSPDAVSNVVDRIAECVAAPVRRADDDDDGDSGDATSALLTRTSLLGVFVRKFLVAVHRLLFDGISRLYDDVVQYYAQFKQDEARALEAYAGSGDDDSDDNSDAAHSGGDNGAANGHDDSMDIDMDASPQSEASVELHWRRSRADGSGDDSLVLSPIPTRESGVGVTDLTPLAHSASPFSHSSSPSGSASPPIAQHSADISLDVVAAVEPHDADVWSHDQLNYVLSDMQRTIERERALNANVRIDDDDPLSVQLLHVTQRDRSTPSVLFVKYLDFLHRRDYQGALDSLHQYHDIALLAAKQSARRSADAADASGGAESSAASGSSAMAMHFQGSGVQYAALNLAGLQILFDHFDAAVESIQEAIRVAQHHGDHVCVAFALAWLVRVHWSLGKPKAQVLGLLKSCVARAKELRIASLEVLGALAQLESDLLRGASSERSAAQTVNSMASAAGAGSGAAGGRGIHGSGNPLVAAAQQSSATHPTRESGGVQWLKSIDSVLESVWKLSGKLSLSAAVSWHVSGHRTLATLFERLHLLCFHDTASACELALSVCSLAAYQLSSDNDDDGSNANVYARGLSFLVDTMDDASATGDLIQYAPVQRKLHSLFFLWALRAGQFVRAKLHVDLLLDLSPAHKDLPAHIEALVARAALWRESGHYTRALELLIALEKTCSEHELAFLRAQVLIARAQTLQQATATDAPLSALPTALQAAQLCAHEQYDLLLAETHLVIAEIYLVMGKTDDADVLVREQMPLVMEHGDVNVRGESLLVLAKAALGGASATDNDPKPALELLEQSATMFAAAQNVRRLREVAYLQAVVFNHLSSQTLAPATDKDAWREYKAKREVAATAFVRLDERLARARHKPVEPFVDLELTDSIRRLIHHRMCDDE